MQQTTIQDGAHSIPRRRPPNRRRRTTENAITNCLTQLVIVEEDENLVADFLGEHLALAAS